MTVANPVGQQLTPTHCCRGTRGGKRERNLHAEGCSSPSKPSAGGRASGRRSRRVGNRRTGRHTGNYRTITGNLHATPPPKCSTLYHSLPLPQPRANTTPTFLFPTPHPPNSPPSSSSDKCRQNDAEPSMHLNNFGPSHTTKPASADASTHAIDTNLHSCSQCIQWVQPGGPMGIPTTMPDHVQCSPSELYIRVSQGMLCNKLPKENGSRVV